MVLPFSQNGIVQPALTDDFRPYFSSIFNNQHSRRKFLQRRKEARVPRSGHGEMQS